MRFGTRLAIAALGAAVAACGAPRVRSVSGEQTFVTHCASCHGASGVGDGPVAASLQVPVPDLRGLCTRAGGVFPEDHAASNVDGRALPAAHGTRAMPVWGPVFATTHELVRGAPGAEERIDALIAYLRELQTGCGAG
jgi:mono/diheme cytochrome c family protein